MSPGGEEAVAALAQDELKQALETIGIGEYDPAVRGMHTSHLKFELCSRAVNLQR